MIPRRSSSSVSGLYIIILAAGLFCLPVLLDCFLLPCLLYLFVLGQVICTGFLFFRAEKRENKNCPVFCSPWANLGTIGPK